MSESVPSATAHKCLVIGLKRLSSYAVEKLSEAAGS